MVADATAADLLREMESLHQRLREMLADDDPRYVERPPSGKWSVVENLCHLLFAEQLHLGRYLPSPPPWHPFGLPPTGMQAQARFKGLAVRPSGAREVFDAWAVVHESTKELANSDSPQVRNRLARHIKHLNTHTRVIERLCGLRAAESPKRRATPTAGG